MMMYVYIYISDDISSFLTSERFHLLRSCPGTRVSGPCTCGAASSCGEPVLTPGLPGGPVDRVGKIHEVKIKHHLV